MVSMFVIFAYSKTLRPQGLLKYLKLVFKIEAIRHNVCVLSMENPGTAYHEVKFSKNVKTHDKIMST